MKNFSTKNSVHKEIVWSKGKTKGEIAKQTIWSSLKDWSGLSGLKILCFKHNIEVGITAITSQGVSHNKYLQIPVDKIEEVCKTLMQAKKLMESNNEKV
tara:strand:+ start:318 stop:614 length:297 start_codon:yes stop_codon:yes gene_type:complete